MDVKRIIIFYEHINREYEACLRLKNEIENSGAHYSVHLLSITFEYSKALKINKRNIIDMVILPWVYVDNDYKLLQPFLRKNKNLYIINLHHEQITSEVTDKALLPRGENARNSVIHFVWGEFFKEKLLDSKVNDNLIYITGNIRNDKLSLGSIDKDELSKEFQLDINKKWILFSENRGWVLSNTERKDNHRLALGFSKDDLNERKILTQESLERTLNEFHELPDSFFKDHELIYRPHPGTEAPENIDCRIKIISKYSIYTWISAIDVNVVWSSTTIFESDIKGVPSIVYEPMEHPEKFKPYGINNYPKISKFEQINDELIKYYKDIIAPNKIFEKYIGLVDGKSVERAQKAITMILSEGVKGYNPKIIDYKKRKIFRKILFEFITKFFVKFNILEFIKYPNTAYALRNDIPYREGRLPKVNNASKK